MISNLPAGTYKLTEDTSPLGYTKDTEITFTINADGTITSDRYEDSKIVVRSLQLRSARRT